MQLMYLEVRNSQFELLSCANVFCRIAKLLSRTAISGLILSASFASAATFPSEIPTGADGLGYTNLIVADVPWSIHIVEVDRRNPAYQICSIHAHDSALSLDTLSDQVALVASGHSVAVAGLNGDFYQRDKAYVGAPRGLQVSQGELLSGPSGESCFWLDAIGEPHADKVESRFQIIWPDGSTNSFGLNGERKNDAIELYTKAVGPSTHTHGGRELILSQINGGAWPPLHLGRTYKARVREIREAGNTKLTPDVSVLSLGKDCFHKRQKEIKNGDILEISTASEPALHGIKTAISGGPVLVRNGRRQRLDMPDSESYQVTSMVERHPRAAIGWNDKYFFLVEVDGRQRDLSVGMTLEELS